MTCRLNNNNNNKSKIKTFFHMFGTDCQGIETLPYDYLQHQKEVVQMGSTDKPADHFISLALIFPVA